MLALVLASALSASPVSFELASQAQQSPRSVVGLDATDITGFFFSRPPKIDERWLTSAPTSSDVAFAASITATLTGLSVATGFILMIGFVPTLPVVAMLTGTFVGVLMASYGPNMGDLLNGDATRFALHGTLRAASLLLLALAGPYGLLAWTGWLVADILQSRNAPARWVERTHGTLDPQALTTPQRTRLVVARF